MLFFVIGDYQDRRCAVEMFFLLQSMFQLLSSLYDLVQNHDYVLHTCAWLFVEVARRHFVNSSEIYKFDAGTTVTLGVKEKTQW